MHFQFQVVVRQRFRVLAVEEGQRDGFYLAPDERLHKFALLLRRWPTALVLLATFGLTLVKDLTFGIVAGCVVAAVLTLIRARRPGLTSVNTEVAAD